MTTTSEAAPMMHSPPHPCQIQCELYLAALRIALIEAAKALGVTSKHVSGIVNGHVRVAADMAIRLVARQRATARGLPGAVPLSPRMP